MNLPRSRITNSVLYAIPAADLAFLTPSLVHVDLPSGTRLQSARQPIENLYFLAEGFAAITVGGGRAQQIDVAMVGYEGVVGLPLALGISSSPYDAQMQVS